MSVATLHTDTKLAFPFCHSVEPVLLLFAPHHLSAMGAELSTEIPPEQLNWSAEVAAKKKVAREKVIHENPHIATVNSD